MVSAAWGPDIGRVSGQGGPDTGRVSGRCSMVPEGELVAGAAWGPDIGRVSGQQHGAHRES